MKNTAKVIQRLNLKILLSNKSEDRLKRKSVEVDETSCKILKQDKRSNVKTLSKRDRAVDLDTEDKQQQQRDITEYSTTDQIKNKSSSHSPKIPLKSVSKSQQSRAMSPKRVKECFERRRPEDRESASDFEEDRETSPALSKTQLEILELEMRARAIKAMLKAQEDFEKHKHNNLTPPGEKEFNQSKKDYVKSKDRVLTGEDMNEASEEWRKDKDKQVIDTVMYCTLVTGMRDV